MQLKRKLGFWQVFCIATGAMISSGLFVLPGLAAIDAGPAVVLSYAFAGILVIPALMSKAELATAMPRSGGSYFFIERSMGALPGTLAGLANWLSISLKAAFALVGIGAFARLIWPAIDYRTIQLIAVAACLVFTVLNILSVKGVGSLQVAMVAVLLCILAVFVFAGFPATKHVHFEHFMAKGFGSVLATAGMVFVSFGGLTKVASVAEEVRRPGRNLPAGMFAAVIVVSFLYVAAVFVAVGVLGVDGLSGSLTPLSSTAGQFMGKGGMVVLAFAAMLAFVTTANGGILTASRSPLAMGRDGLLPAATQKVSRRFGTPYVSILATSAFIIAVISLLDIYTLVKAASAMMLTLFALVNVAVLIMRRSRIQNYRPLYRSPLYPYLQLAGIAVYVFLIVEMGRIPLLIAGAFALLGVLWYIVYVRRRIVRESAFVYMVKGVVSKEMYRSQLEEELKEIALERDEITRDRFDRLVGECEILDLSGRVKSEEMFRRAAAALAPRLKTDEQRLFQQFMEREAQSSTVIQPGLAIPHVVVDGSNLFDVLLIRSRDGVEFPGQAEPVRVVFMLVGSRDERNYHLKALMAIAHVVEEPGFLDRWLAAPEAEHLRDIVLLSKRRRES